MPAHITYSFPTTSDVYGTPSTYGDPAPFNGFLPVTAQQKGEILRGFSLISSYTGLSFSEITETADTHATLRFANSFSPATAYAYYPGTYAAGGRRVLRQARAEPCHGQLRFRTGPAARDRPRARAQACA